MRLSRTSRTPPARPQPPPGVMVCPRPFARLSSCRRLGRQSRRLRHFIAAQLVYVRICYVGSSRRRLPFARIRLRYAGSVFRSRRLGQINCRREGFSCARFFARCACPLAAPLRGVVGGLGQGLMSCNVLSRSSIFYLHSPHYKIRVLYNWHLWLIHKYQLHAVFFSSVVSCFSAEKNGL